MVSYLASFTCRPLHLQANFTMAHSSWSVIEYRSICVLENCLVIINLAEEVEQTLNWPK